jgi:hypothetical protein
MNEIIIDGKIYNLVGIWKKSKSDKSVDSKGNQYLFPSVGKVWTGSDQFVKRLLDVENYITRFEKKNIINVKNSDTSCVLCPDTTLSKKRFILENYIWDTSLSHYVKYHNYEPHRDFIDKIFEYDISVDHIVKLKARVKHEKSGQNFLKLDKNQIMILDALMKHGGYNKKYYDRNNKNIVRNSEHAGFLDIRNKIVHNIIVSGNTMRVDRGDEEIFLPVNTPDAFMYEYIFHTHPPTPKPGGRAKDGILYEFPSLGDIFHFIDHHNDGKVRGSLVMTSEGLYNIRKLNNDLQKIEINEEEFYVTMKKIFRSLQKESLEKYGKGFNTYKFYSVIAQDKSFIEKANEVLNKYGLIVDFFQREKDFRGSWVVDTIYIPL